MEARYVRRVDDYFICYLSSHTGCNKSCRFCHLTQTGQVDMVDATIDDYIKQASHVLDYYDSVGNPAKKVNFNFMSRGEVLANQVFLKHANEISNALQSMASKRGLQSNFNISTIMPDDVADIDLSTLISNEYDHMFYYSLYSINPSFRKKWIPKSLPVDDALNKLKSWQGATGRTLALHWAFIENENDDEQDIKTLLAKINEHGLDAKFNLVRYNPYSEKQGQESSEDVIERNFSLIASDLQNTESRIVPRVGFDVKASCGMFVT
jgi:adenine C2-methylase RlmN of 23S rRNA A2503 and tRNA A37